MDKVIESSMQSTIPAAYLPDNTPKKREDFRDTMQWRVFRIMAEFIEGFQFINDFSRTVSFFGSARLTPDNIHYQQAIDLAKALVAEDFGIVTGGGPGIMEAGNKGALEAGGKSIGLNIQLPTLERRNRFVDQGIGFHYFFTRKVMLSFAAEAYVFFPGGFGTLDEFFEMVTLVQTDKIPKVPLILIGKDFWKPLDEFICKTLLEEHFTVSREDIDLYSITDDLEEAVKIIADSANGLR